MANSGPGAGGGLGNGGSDAAGAGVAGALGGTGNEHAAGAADSGEGGEASGEGGALENGGMGGGPGDAGGDNHGGAGGSLLEPSLPKDGLLVWLRADVGLRENGHVWIWEDQSGNQMNATQPTVNARPSYLPTGFNGRPTLEFDGHGKFLKFADGFGDFSKGLAGLIVARPTKSECASMVEFSNGQEIEDISFGTFQDKWTYEVAADFMQTGSVDHGNFSLYTANHRQSEGSALRINGSVLATQAISLPVVPESTMRVNNFIGHTLYGNGCEYFEGQISEFILYSRSLTNLELTVIEKYLSTHWALSDQGIPLP